MIKTKFNSFIIIFTFIFLFVPNKSITQSIIWDPTFMKIEFLDAEYLLKDGDTISLRYSKESDYINKKIKKNDFVLFHTGEPKRYRNEDIQYSLYTTLLRYNYAYYFNREFKKLLSKADFLDSINVTHHNYSNTILIKPFVKKIITHSNNKTASSYWYLIEYRISWVVYNYYEEPLDTITHTSKSSIYYSKDVNSADKNDYKIYKKATDDFLLNPHLEIVKSNFNHLIQKLYSANFLNKKQSDSIKTITFIKSDSKYSNQDLNNSIKSSVTIKSKNGHGSGFFISEDGYIVTNYHVVASSKDNLTIISNDNKEYSAEVVNESPESDLALLKINALGTHPLLIDSNSVKISEDVIAIGTPKNILLGQTISKGIVSGFRNMGGTDYIQTDVSINSGNSGGALLNKNGSVIGIVTAKYTGIGVEGIGFALPSKYIFNMLGVKYQ